MELAAFVESALRRTGGLTERGVPDLVEAILPAPVAASLQLPEEVRLRVRGAPAAGEAHAGFGSSLLAQLCGIATGTTRRFRAFVAPALPRRERVLKEAEKALTFQNAVGRIESLEESVLEHLAFDFRFETLSEERHEGLLSIAIDREMGWSPDLARALCVYLAEHADARRPWPALEEARDLRVDYARARALAMTRAREESEAFIGRMARRLQRDTHRAQDYYGALRAEVEKRGARGRGTPELLKTKVDAIETEKGRRLHDLRRRYAVTLKVEPLCVLALRVSGLRLQAKLQRRKNEKRVRLGWNPITREFDHWLCGGCGGAAGLPALCDAMHMLCNRCASPCAACGQRGCPACTSGLCRCGASLPGIGTKFYIQPASGQSP